MSLIAHLSNDVFVKGIEMFSYVEGALVTNIMQTVPPALYLSPDDTNFMLYHIFYQDSAGILGKVI